MKAKTSGREVILFDENDITQAQLSDTIRVTDRPVLVTHWNLIEGEYVCLMRYMVDGCLDSESGNIIFEKDDDCNYICMCCPCRNTLKITQPGTYKLVKRGELNNAHVTYRYLSTSHVCC